MVVVVEEPTIEAGFPQCCLNCAELHVHLILCPRFVAHAGCKSADFLHACSRDDMRCGFLKRKTAMT
jgi:hypothetical protein